MGKSHAAGWSSDAPTAAQLKEFFAQIESGRMTGCKLQQALKTSPSPYFDLIARWKARYQDAGLEVDFSGLVIPKKPEGFYRMIVNATTPQGAYDLCQKKFKCWKYVNASLDEAIVHEDRSAKNGAYAIWVEDSQEPSEKLKNQSANSIKELGISTETLTERLLHGYDYYLETGKHLDIKNQTYCTGSRYTDGGVPYVGWSGFHGRMYVYWAYPSYADDFLRSRQVVS